MFEEGTNKENFSEVSNSRAAGHGYLEQRLVETKPSKSSEKGKKGISRVKMMTQQHKEEVIVKINPPLCHQEAKLTTERRLNFDSSQTSQYVQSMGNTFIQQTTNPWERQQIILQKEIMDLEARNAQLTKQITSLKQLREQEVVKNGKIQIQCSILRTENERLNQVIHKTSQNVANNEKVIQENTSTIHYLESMIKSLKQHTEPTLAQLQKQKLELQQKYQSLLISSKNIQYSSNSEKISVLQYENHQLKLQLTEKSHEIQTLKTETHKLSHYEQLQDQYELLRQQNEQYRKLVDELERKRMRLIETHNEQVRKLSSTEYYQERQHHKEVGRIAQDLERLKSEKERLEMQKKMIQKQADRQFEEIEAKHKHLITKMGQQYEDIIFDLEGKVKNWTSKEEQYRQRIQILTNQNIELKHRVDRIVTESQLLKNKLDYNSRDRSRSQHAPGSASKRPPVSNTQMQYEVEITRLEDKAKSLQLAFEKTKCELEQQTRTVKHYSQEIQHHRKEKDQLLQHKVLHSDELRALKSQLKFKNSEHEQLKSLYQEQKQELKRVLEELENKVTSVHSQTQKLSEKEAIIGRLKQEVKQKEQNEAIWENKYQTLQQIMNSQKQSLLTQELTLQQYKGKLSTAESKPDDSHKDRVLIYEQICRIANLKPQLDENVMLKKIYGKVWEQTKIITEYELHQKQIQTKLQQSNVCMKQLEQLRASCRSYEQLIIKMQETHNGKLEYIKKDYDVLYGKYLKYRNMSIALQQQYK